VSSPAPASPTSLGSATRVCVLAIAAIGFLLLVCVYFSFELSRLEERTRILAEELAILRAEQETDGGERTDDRLPQ